MRLVDRRIGLLFALFLTLFLVAVVRATWLSTVKAGELSDRAVSQQVEDLDVPARRGTIFDRHGVELAVSEEAVTVFANPFLIKDPVKVASRLSPLLGRPQQELLGELSNKKTGFVYLKRKLDPTSGDRVKRMKLEGIGTVTEPKRSYPQRALGSQLLGSVGTDGYGLSGLEQSRERTLKGTNGKRRLVKDAMGEPVQIVETERARAGGDVHLTLDAAIQARTEVVLGQVGQKYRPRGATALVMDPRSGEVLALANWPRIDNNSVGDAPAYARQNRAVAANYEPGSTFKAFTVAGALEEKLIEPQSEFDLPPTLQVADREIKESHPRGQVTLTVGDILAQSSNVGSVKIGMELGPERFDRWVRRFGFGKGTNVDLPGEATGIVPKPAEYSGSSMGNLPIGQGIAVTPVQMATAYSAIANHGVSHSPYIVRGNGREGRRVVSRRTADRVSKMLEGVLGPGGTAQEAKVKGYRLAGKTGTAEKADPRGGYSKDKFVASFIGYAPVGDPRLLVAVMVDEPKGDIFGGTVAAPAFEQIMDFALPYLKIPPR